MQESSDGSENEVDPHPVGAQFHIIEDFELYRLQESTDGQHQLVVHTMTGEAVNLPMVGVDGLLLEYKLVKDDMGSGDAHLLGGPAGRVALRLHFAFEIVIPAELEEKHGKGELHDADYIVRCGSQPGFNDCSLAVFKAQKKVGD